MDKPPLERTTTDLVAAAARSIANACPFIGGLIAEVINGLIPNQKLDRVIEWTRLLDQKLAAAEGGLNRIRERLRDEHGLDLFEDATYQAARGLTEERRERIANLLARSLTQEELKYAESKKLLNILRELTDPEIVMLIFYSKTPTLGSKWHKDYMEKHPEVRPVSATKGSSQEEVDKAVLQESYRNTLVRLGLLRERDRSQDLTSLGRLLLLYILPPGAEEEDSAS